MNLRCRQTGTASGWLLKIMFGCAFLLLMIFWQRYYFNAIDDVEDDRTSLWNWPTIVLVVLGVGAALLHVVKAVRRHRS